MTKEEAIKILDPEISTKAFMEILYQHNYMAQAVFDALNLAVAALRDQEERENPKPLTLDELLQVDEDPVWVKLFGTGEEFLVLRKDWADTRNPELMILFHMRWYSHADYGKTWIAYRSKPKEDCQWMLEKSW